MVVGRYELSGTEEENLAAVDAKLDKGKALLEKVRERKARDAAHAAEKKRELEEAKAEYKIAKAATDKVVLGIGTSEKEEQPPFLRGLPPSPLFAHHHLLSCVSPPPLLPPRVLLEQKKGPLAFFRRGNGPAPAPAPTHKKGDPPRSAAVSNAKSQLQTREQRQVAAAKAANKAKAQALAEMADYQRMHGVGGDLSRTGPLRAVPNQLAFWRKRGPQRSAGIPTKVPSVAPGRAEEKHEDSDDGAAFAERMGALSHGPPGTAL